ncbi:hypothetical protein CPB86DRAFT_337019 [Serendipita vermifera]|nr:hypothetical protein CPB86DRAFT_337019 [Serendipita vermifera]
MSIVDACIRWVGMVLSSLWSLTLCLDPVRQSCSASWGRSELLVPACAECLKESSSGHFLASAQRSCPSRSYGRVPHALY